MAVVHVEIGHVCEPIEIMKVEVRVDPVVKVENYVEEQSFSWVHVELGKELA
jgi:ERCC4-related helicase